MVTKNAQPYVGLGVYPQYEQVSVSLHHRTFHSCLPTRAPLEYTPIWGPGIEVPHSRMCPWPSHSPQLCRRVVEVSARLFELCCSLHRHAEYYSTCNIYFQV